MDVPIMSGSHCEIYIYIYDDDDDDCHDSHPSRLGSTQTLELIFPFFFFTAVSVCLQHLFFDSTPDVSLSIL